MRSLRLAASWQINPPEEGKDPDAGAWRVQARCKDYDPDLFFPIGSSGPALRQTRRAKAVCRQCPVQAKCLEWALATDQTHGVWGGLDEQERENLRLGHRTPDDGEPGLEEPIARPA